jgi:ER membrane protein complex subunit 4
MNLMLLWLIPNAQSIFTLSMVAMTMFSPIRGMISVNTAFAPFQEARLPLFQAKMIFLALHFLNFLILMYKASKMGFLPTAITETLAPAGFIPQQSLWV